MNELPPTAWGHPNRYYAGSTVEVARSSLVKSDTRAQSNEHWHQLLEQASPGVRSVVECTYKQWNNILRDYLRSETALRLTVGNEAQAVPVRIVAGMPAPFAEVLKQFEGLDWLLLNRPAVVAAVEGAGFVEGHLGNALMSLGEKGSQTTAEEARHVRETAELWLKELDKSRMIEELAGIREDVLGAYYFRVPEIRLYWVVIGILSVALGVTPEALTIVTLAHELAHAYTHLGRDIDDERWDTEVFAATELDIVEGLAQFYTQVICTRLEARMPAAPGAFEALLAKQSGPYKAHIAWVSSDERGGEIVRVSMIECRSRRLREASEFTAAIKRNRSQVKGRSEDS